ncbi:TPA: hypothetical protein ACH3X1_012473 [Trebouxia sp. C0004]
MLVAYVNLHCHAVQEKIQEHGDSSDEEEPGRSGAFTRKKLPQIPQGQLISPGQHFKKKKKHLESGQQASG